MSLLRARAATTPAMQNIWSDETTLARALQFEAALACAQAREGLITPDVADAIEARCMTAEIDIPTLAGAAALAGTLAIPLIAELRAGLTGDAAAALHRGATSQDLADTVLMRQVRDATALVMTDARRISTALAALADAKAITPAIGRTLLQNALPIGFGLRIAQWRAGIVTAADRLEHEVATSAVLQLGGAAGTRAGMAGVGDRVTLRLAELLDLPPALPWHGRRGGVAAIGAALAILIGTLGKMARDVSLLAQNAVAEAREPAVPGRGGSSAMAHKRNPTGCQVALAAATRAPGLAATLLSGLPAEQERGLGGWQAEGPVLTDLFLIAAGAADAMAGVAEGLEIDGTAIARNLAAANIGEDIGESAAITAALIGN